MHKVLHEKTHVTSNLVVCMRRTHKKKHSTGVF